MLSYNKTQMPIMKFLFFKVTSKTLLSRYIVPNAMQPMTSLEVGRHDQHGSHMK